ncbi:DUF2269 domain-containing protein [Kocuria sp. M1R5S2]|uniref:DUF2269 domain-containing protein n=1 Tax=Kocuria rhizosphaerae TaxID=3376285 RepID=UPI0037A6EA0B
MAVTMGPRLRRAALLAHVAASVGWFGAVLVVLALALVGVLGQDPLSVRGAYPLMELVARSVLVPLAVLSLVTGLVMSLGTAWGLFRHWWVLFKLALTVLATLLLLTYLPALELMARTAGNAGAGLDAVRNVSPVLHAGAALLVLLAAMVLAVFKPRGLTQYGWRKGRRTAR